MDVSATRLWSEVAPWPSLVQRMGRLNRDGGSNANAQAMFFWDSSAGAKQKKGARVGPYKDDAVSYPRSHERGPVEAGAKWRPS